MNSTKKTIVQNSTLPDNEPLPACSLIQGFNLQAKFCALGCGQWKCDECRIWNSWHIARRARYGMRLWDGNLYFITLTVASRQRNDETKKMYRVTPGIAYDQLPGKWDRLRNLMQSAYKGDWYYFCVAEEQSARRMPHLHIISTRPLPAYQRWAGKLKAGYNRVCDPNDIAVRCGFGFEVDVDPITDVGKAANYLAKYISKGTVDFPDGFRRVRASECWPRLPEPEPGQLIIKSNDETLTEYFMKVADKTGASIQGIYDKWFEGRDRLNSKI